MTSRFAERGGWWVAAQLALMLAIGWLGFAWRDAPAAPGLRGAGVAFLIFSAACGLGGVLALGRNLTPFPKPSANGRLVESGIYGWMRHPLYTSVTCAAIGWSLFRASWPALAVSIALAVFFDAKARREERWLRERFSGYRAYEQRVRRFIPWVY